MGCAAVAAGMPLEQRVGQLYMVGVSTQGLDATTREVITGHHLGSVVLLGNHEDGAEPIAAITDELAGLEVPEPLLVAVDQEGGIVQRLQGAGFDDIPSAVDQAQLGPEQLRAQAAGWAGELADVGVHWNLAPVADVVPAEQQDSNAPIGALRRNYGNDVEVTSASVVAFVEAMAGEGVATSLKHFPGLGHVEDNTDFAAATDTSIEKGDPTWQAFTDGIHAGASSVMVSSAVFENLDPDNEAVFSPTIITDILRGDLGHDGIVIADDLGAAVAVEDIAPADRGNRFLAAGGDVAINADPTVMAEMAEATVEKAQEDPAFEERITESATRVLSLKAELGLTDCQV